MGKSVFLDQIQPRYIAISRYANDNEEHKYDYLHDFPLQMYVPQSGGPLYFQVCNTKTGMSAAVHRTKQKL